jgi:hypothetical protein
MTEKLTHVQYRAQEFRDNARMKRRQAEILIAEANVLDSCSDRITDAVEMDAKTYSGFRNPPRG